MKTEEGLIEVERKFSLNITVEDFVKILSNRGGKFISSESQKDVYFNVSGRDSMSTKECLRIRSEDTRTELTYKAPSNSTESSQNHFSKKEINVELKSDKEMYELLIAIGCEVLAVVEKSRQTYVLDKLTIAIDTVAGLGNFVEVEALVASEQKEEALTAINLAAKNLGLQESATVNEPYRDLIVKRNM